MKRQINIFFMCFAVILSSCGANEDRIPGIYVSNENNILDTLKLYPNHKYSHISIIKNKKVNAESVWDYDGVQITFDDFVFLESTDTVPGYWGVNIDSQFWMVQFIS